MVDDARDAHGLVASEDDQRYLLESEKSGKEAAHKPDSLNKV